MLFLSPLAPYKPDHQHLRTTFLPLLSRSRELMERLVLFESMTGTQREVWTRLCLDLAYIQLSSGRYDDSIKLFSVCIEWERTKEGESWPSTEIALRLLFGLAVSHQRSGDLSNAAEVLETTMKLAELLFDNFDDRTAEISSRLRAVADRYETNLQHHKSVVVASTGEAPSKGQEIETSTDAPAEAFEEPSAPPEYSDNTQDGSVDLETLYTLYSIESSENTKWTKDQ